MIELFKAHLKKFIKEEVKIREYKVTHWQFEEDSLGSYSFVKVGQEQEEWSEELRTAIDDKIWLVGEYLSPKMNGCASGAF
mgnify:CR=1 FL=1